MAAQQCVKFLLLLSIVHTLYGWHMSPFFHENSIIQIRSNDNPISFGSTIAYQDMKPGSSAKLVVGAPMSEKNKNLHQSHLHTCPMDTIFEEKKGSCDEIKIDLKKSRKFDGKLLPFQSYAMGASIVATPDYIFTCAPLVTKSFNEISRPIGHCYKYDGRQRTISYSGFIEYISNLSSRKKEITPNEVTLIGGLGWNMLADEVNKKILISKPTFPSFGDVYFGNLDNPTEQTKSTSFDQNNIHTSKFRSYVNIGYGMAAGKFFSNETYYAVSMQEATRNGKVGFLSKDREILVMADGLKPLLISEPSENFGYGLCSADVNGDGFDDVIVGAPAHYVDDLGHDVGAVFVYLGGKDAFSVSKKRVIVATSSGGQFGTKIAAVDIDGDKLPEIIVSAPYEVDGVGAIYIFSGYEINKLIREPKTHASITELRLTQRIQTTHRNFGYSLKVLPDLDGNGCNELAVGAPGSTAVLLLRCIPSVDVTLTVKAKQSVVKLSDKNFIVEVCVRVSYFFEQAHPIHKLVIINKVTVNEATFAPDTLPVLLSKDHNEKCENVVITPASRIDKSADYNFTARLDTSALYSDLNNNEFNKMWVTLSPKSVLQASVIINRDCIQSPVNIFIEWHGSSPYVLGTSATETVTVTIRKLEHTDCKKDCLRLEIKGGHGDAPCTPVTKNGETEEFNKSQFRCSIPLEEVYSFDMTLDMKNYTNRDSVLAISAYYHHECSSNHSEWNSTMVNLQLSTDGISVNGTQHDMNQTDRSLALLKQENKTLNNVHEYTIKNKQSVNWLNVNVTVKVPKTSYINYKLTILNQESDKSQKEDDKYILLNCKVNLLKNSKLTIILTGQIDPDAIEGNLQKDRLEISSNLVLSLKPTDITVESRLTTVISYHKELSMKHNQTLIIVIAIIVALIILGVAILILFKVGFFNRKSKQRLDSFKQSIRQRNMSIDEERTTSDQAPIIDVSEDDMDMQIVDEPFEIVEVKDAEAPAKEEPTTSTKSTEKKFL